MNLFINSIYKDLIIFPEQTNCIYTPKNSSALIHCQGEAKVTLKQQTFNIKEEMILIPRTSYNELKIASNKGLVKIHMYIFNDEKSGKNEDIVINIDGLPGYALELSKKIFSQQSEETNLCFFELMVLINHKIESGDLSGNNKLTHKKNIIKKKIDFRLIKVNRYIRENYTKPITLQSLSELINVNPVYLSNYYSCVFKISPIHHINTLRINLAKRLIEDNSNESINKIALLVGFSSSSHFCSTFKRYTFTSPSVFKTRLIDKQAQDNKSLNDNE